METVLPCKHNKSNQANINHVCVYMVIAIVLDQACHTSTYVHNFGEIRQIPK